MAKEPKARTDKERLDALQDLLGEYTGRVICRRSSLGKGWRLHESTRQESSSDVREAIDRFLDSGGKLA